MKSPKGLLLAALSVSCIAGMVLAQDAAAEKPVRLPVKLPPCGIFVGSGVYPTCADYVTMTLYGHQTWVPQQYSPQEIIDKVIADNQGNTIQFWGHARGHSPEVVGEWLYALDEIGIRAPAPDWKNGKNLTIHDSPELLAHADRLGAGALRFIKAAANKGLYTTLMYVTSEPEWAKRFQEGGEHYLGYNFGENGIQSGTGRGRRGQGATLQAMAEDSIASMKEVLRARDAGGWGNASATSGNPFGLDYEVLAGLDIPMAEDFAFQQLNIASAISRGLYRQHNLPLWGSHLAHEHYSWIPYTNPHKFDLLKAAMYQKYMSGSKMIILESGNWFVEGSLVEDSPKFTFPHIDLPPYQVRELMANPMLFAPYIEEARKHYDTINYNSPVARHYRKVISDFYDYVKAHGTPEGQPEASVAIAKGNLDMGGRYGGSDPAGGGWGIAEKVFYPLNDVLAPNPNPFLSGTPYGMVDIVSFALDEITAEFLSKNYKALIFVGWNTCSDKQYQILKEYVSNGGKLFIGIPQLSTNARTDRSSSSVNDLINGGDFSELCGVKVKGNRGRITWATAAPDVTELGFKFPRRFGHMGGALGDLEITDPNTKVLVVDDELMNPLLLRRAYGKGEVYFLNSWSYPGSLNRDVGPGARLDSKGLIGTIFQRIANISRGSVWITDDRDLPRAECEYVTFSYFPEAGRICLLNVDFDRPHKFFLHHFGLVEPITLAPGEFRMMETAKLGQPQ